MQNAITPFLVEHALLGLFILSFLAATLVPLGSEWLLVLLVQQGDHSPSTIVAIATVGNYLGSCTNYFIGLYGSDFLINKVLRISQGQLIRAKKFYGRYGIWSLFFSWLPLIGDPLCLLGGLFKIKLSIFSLLVFCGKMFRYTLVSMITLYFT